MFKSELIWQEVLSRLFAFLFSLVTIPMVTNSNKKSHSYPEKSEGAIGFWLRILCDRREKQKLKQCTKQEQVGVSPMKNMFNFT